MFILILGLAVIATIICIIISIKTSPSYDKYGIEKFGIDGLCFLLAWFFSIVAIIMVIIICCLAPQVAKVSILEDKIAMYQEENEIIEQDIDRIVEVYLKHEQDTFADIKTEESSITLITLFPDLKSDTLVQQQIEIYVANNEKIKSLKEEKIDIAQIKWLLYFGSN